LRNMPEIQAKIIAAPEKGLIEFTNGDEPGVKLRKGKSKWTAVAR
jgi:hypothetical protein